MSCVIKSQPFMLISSILYLFLMELKTNKKLSVKYRIKFKYISLLLIKKIILTFVKKYGVFHECQVQGFF